MRAVDNFCQSTDVAEMATMNISIPAKLKTFVESQVATGQFASASDYFRTVVREREQAVERLRALLDEGEASGTSPHSFEEIMAGIKERHRSRSR